MTPRFVVKTRHAAACAQGLVALVASCTGAIEEGDFPAPDPAAPAQQAPRGGGDGKTPGAMTAMPAPPSSGTPPGTAPAPAVACKEIEPGPSPLRRLNRAEYNNTVRDLLGDTTRPADAFPPEEAGNGFGNDADALTVSRLLVDQYFSAAKGIAERATADAARFARLLGCDPARGEEACARTFVESFGERAFRRPLAPAEVTDLLAVYGAVRPGADFRTGIQAVLRTVLQAPEFLYRIEVGEPPAPGAKVTRPTQHETASRLSYLLWGTLPDVTLLAEAKAGRLGTKEQILAQARRMLQDARAREMTRSFRLMLLSLGGLDKLQKDVKVFPRFTAEVPRLLAEEMNRFLDAAVWDGAGDVQTMLTASFSFMNAPLAKFYGQPGITGDAFQRVELDPARRTGFMTQAGMMAALSPGDHTNPIVRGTFVRSQLLCSPVPSPPPALMIQEPKPDPKQTTRQRFAAHRNDPVCASCHALFDPIGFGFESYDAAGLFRTTENGKPLDVSGEVVGTDIAGPFDGAADLMRKLAGSNDARRCMLGKWTSFAYGRAITEQDRCTVASLEGAFARSGYKIQELLLALTQTEAFLYRKVGP